MRVLIAGSRGLLGTDITPILGASFDVTSVDIEEWDITDRKAGEARLEEYRPDVVLNLAAYTDVDGCEDNPELAQKVNAEAAGTVADLCASRKTKLVHISTDYVFDGRKKTPYREDDLTNPVSIYGKSKLAGEQRILGRDPSFLVVRAQWLYGKGGVNFITKVTKLGRERPAIDVVDDQRGCPTYARDLGEPLKRLIERDCSGIYHVTNSGSCTWYEFAREIFSILRLPAEVRPTTSENLQRKAVRPSYSVFDCSRLQRDTGVIMRSWHEALREYLG
jgi:dTDP-4-dehydrorhamnose reductase